MSCVPIAKIQIIIVIQGKMMPTIILCGFYSFAEVLKSLCMLNYDRALLTALKPRAMQTLMSA